tara:strand:- start:160 stop:354 length:195 start_codon:yes stop_codon:yes gene_type:complete
MKEMIHPISLNEYMTKIAKRYQNMPESPEKEKLWLEIKRIADGLYPTVKIEDISKNNEEEESNS